MVSQFYFIGILSCICAQIQPQQQTKSGKRKRYTIIKETVSLHEQQLQELRQKIENLQRGQEQLSVEMDISGIKKALNHHHNIMLARLDTLEKQLTNIPQGM